MEMAYKKYSNKIKKKKKKNSIIKNTAVKEGIFDIGKYMEKMEPTERAVNRSIAELRARLKHSHR